MGLGLSHLNHVPHIDIELDSRGTTLDNGRNMSLMNYHSGSPQRVAFK